MDYEFFILTRNMCVCGVFLSFITHMNIFLLKAHFDVRKIKCMEMWVISSVNVFIESDVSNVKKFSMEI